MFQDWLFWLCELQVELNNPRVFDYCDTWNWEDADAWIYWESAKEYTKQIDRC